MQDKKLGVISQNIFIKSISISSKTLLGHLMSKAVEISFIWSHPVIVCVKYFRMDTQIESTTHCLFRVGRSLNWFILGSLLMWCSKRKRWQEFNAKQFITLTWNVLLFILHYDTFYSTCLQHSKLYFYPYFF